MPGHLRPALIVVLAAAGALIAGCSAPATTNAAAAPRPSTSATPGSGQPGTSGTIAAVSGSSIEVQNPAFGQVTVTYTASTRFTRTVTVSPAALVVGDCVQAVDANRRATASPSASPPASGGPLAVTSVTITGKADASGSCAAATGMFGRNGAGQPGADASRSPRPRPSGSARAGFRGGFGGAAVGRVVSVSGGTFVVQRAARNGATAGTETVSTSATTTWLQVQPATAGAIAVGECATALGRPDDTGAVAATAINLRAPGPQGCVSGTFGRGGAGNGGSGGTNG